MRKGKLILLILIILMVMSVSACDNLINGWKTGEIYGNNQMKESTVLVFEAEAEVVTKKQIATVIDIMRTRLDSLGYTEATIRR